VCLFFCCCRPPPPTNPFNAPSESHARPSPSLSEISLSLVGLLFLPAFPPAYPSPFINLRLHTLTSHLNLTPYLPPLPPPPPPHITTHLLTTSNPPSSRVVFASPSRYSRNLLLTIDLPFNVAAKPHPSLSSTSISADRATSLSPSELTTIPTDRSVICRQLPATARFWFIESTPLALLLINSSSRIGKSSLELSIFSFYVSLRPPSEGPQ
jgi:hypothetical protein